MGKVPNLLIFTRCDIYQSKFGEMVHCGFFSACAFESANHHSIAAVSGTIKTPEKNVERFIRRQNINLGKSTNLEKRYTQVAVEKRNFCHDLKIDFFLVGI